VLTLLRDLQIPLEINVMSNVSLHVFRRLAEHPFPHLDRMGLKVTLNSDDPPLFNTTLCDEYRVVAREFGYGRRDLARIARNAFEVCAAPTELQRLWLAEFDAWCARQPDLS
jgi:aminodeoxyfutalosine deaminase